MTTPGPESLPYQTGSLSLSITPNEYARQAEQHDQSPNTLLNDFAIPAFERIPDHQMHEDKECAEQLVQTVENDMSVFRAGIENTFQLWQGVRGLVDFLHKLNSEMETTVQSATPIWEQLSELRADISSANTELERKQENLKMLSRSEPLYSSAFATRNASLQRLRKRREDLIGRDTNVDGMISTMGSSQETYKSVIDRELKIIDDSIVTEQERRDKSYSELRSKLSELSEESRTYPDTQQKFDELAKTLLTKRELFTPYDEKRQQYQYTLLTLQRYINELVDKHVYSGQKAHDSDDMANSGPLPRYRHQVGLEQ